MKSILGFGDIHFGDTSEWTLDVGENFLKWLREYDFGNKDDLEAVFVGDVNDRDTNAGSCIKQDTELADILSEKFKHIYILTGNHDKKLHKNVEQNSLDFLKTWKSISVIEKPELLTTENGFKCLLLPYMRTESQTLHDYYNDLPKELTSSEVDIIAGHWNKVKPGDIWMDDGVDINKLPKAKDYFIGHVHTRDDKDYTGSIWPNKVSEQESNYKRAVKVLHDDSSKDEIILPEFLHYDEIDYPNKINSPSDSAIHVYTVKKCNNLSLAKAFYKENYVRAVEKTDDMTTDIDLKSEDKTFLFKSNKEAFDSMIKDTDIKVSRQLYQYVSTLL